MTTPKFGIMSQPFTKNIEVGRLNKAGDRFIGEKEDCTEAVIGAVANHVIRKHGGSFEQTFPGGIKMTISVEVPGETDE